jgi:GntR family transcriptional regulator / MocR family aminotransferase
LGLALQRALRDAIRQGRLRAHMALPSPRALAADLGVSRSLVVLAYEQLAAEGYLVTRPGAAARVASVHLSQAAAPSAPRGAANDRATIDFRPGTADLGSFPRVEWERAVRRSLAKLPDAALGYGDSRGLPQLREALADYLGRVRGAIVDPEDVVVVNGFAQGLAVVARLLRRHGIRTVGVEDPGSPHTAGQLAAHDLDVIGVPVDGDGIDVDAREAQGAPALRAVLTTPAHQFPTGVVLSADRRRRLLAWADQVDGYVVEDDYDAEYRYDHQPVATVQGLAPNRVVLGGSTSKTLVPGLRLGWLAVPPHLSDEAALCKRHLDLMSPIMEQAAFADLLTSGAYERHIRRNRAVYKGRRDTLLELVATLMPSALVRGEAAGLHVLIETPTVTDEQAVIGHATRDGLQLSGAAGYRRARGPAGFVLAYGHLNHDQLHRGVQILAAAVAATGG